MGIWRNNIKQNVKLWGPKRRNAHSGGSLIYFWGYLLAISYNYNNFSDVPIHLLFSVDSFDANRLLLRFVHRWGFPSDLRELSFSRLIYSQQHPSIGPNGRPILAEQHLFILPRKRIGNAENPSFQGPRMLQHNREGIRLKISGFIAGDRMRIGERNIVG